MINKPTKHTPVSRKKKLAKKLKNYIKESFKKLLTLLIKQEVCRIIIQDILKSSLSVHKIIFQNLSPEL